jgi:hypothetical protein
VIPSSNIAKIIRSWIPRRGSDGPIADEVVPANAGITEKRQPKLRIFLI